MNVEAGPLARLPFDEKLDASMILTDFVRSGVLATDGYSPAVKNYVNEVVEGDKVEMQLEALNHSIVMENRRISKVTPAVIQAREALLNG